MTEPETVWLVWREVRADNGEIVQEELICVCADEATARARCEPDSILYEVEVVT